MFKEDSQEAFDLLNNQQVKEFLASSKRQDSQVEKLKKWTIYWKKRGKARTCNQQQYDQEPGQDYSKDLQEVGRFSTLKQFFGYFTSIKEPSSMEKDIKVFYFLNDCKPLWEEWLHSGCLLITIKFKDEEKDEVGARILNSTWQFLLLGLVGNSLPKPRGGKDNKKQEQAGKQLIIGLIFQRRDKISLIEVWYRNELSASQLTRLLQEDIEKHLQLKTKQETSAISMKYKRHKDSIQTSSTLKGGSHFKMMSFGVPSMPNQSALRQTTNIVHS